MSVRGISSIHRTHTVASEIPMLHLVVSAWLACMHVHAAGCRCVIKRGQLARTRSRRVCLSFFIFTKRKRRSAWSVCSKRASHSHLRSSSPTFVCAWGAARELFLSFTRYAVSASSVLLSRSLSSASRTSSVALVSFVGVSSSRIRRENDFPALSFARLTSTQPYIHPPTTIPSQAYTIGIFLVALPIPPVAIAFLRTFRNACEDIVTPGKTIYFKYFFWDSTYVRFAHCARVILQILRNKH